MNQRQFQRLTKLLRQCNANVILAAADICDGHSILNPQAFLDAGLPQQVVDHLTRRHQSDHASPKGTIFVAGKLVKELSGVYGLDLLRFLALALGVQYARALGRGFEARNIQAALRQHFQHTTATPD